MNPANKVPQTKKSINGLVQKQVWVNMNDPVQKQRESMGESANQQMPYD
jgi:hypothetical protein